VVVKVVVPVVKVVAVNILVGLVVVKVVVPDMEKYITVPLVVVTTNAPDRVVVRVVVPLVMLVVKVVVPPVLVVIKVVVPLVVLVSKVVVGMVVVKVAVLDVEVTVVVPLDMLVTKVRDWVVV
jgi:hypothetical protein